MAQRHQPPQGHLPLATSVSCRSLRRISPDNDGTKDKTRLNFDPPFPIGHVDDNDEIKVDAIRPHHTFFVGQIKRNRLAGRLDRIVCYNGKCVYECVWDKADGGSQLRFCLECVDWSDLANTGDFPKEAALAWTFLPRINQRVLQVARRSSCRSLISRNSIRLDGESPGQGIRPLPSRLEYSHISMWPYRPMPETLTGLIERVTYHNPENGFAVLKVLVKGRQDLVTVVGSTTSVSAGEHLEATGKWVVDREHGQQFKADELKTTHPASAEGIEKYLASGAIRSIGPKLAAKIVGIYKERTLEIFETAPDFLLHIKGIGQERVKRIRQSWQEQKEVRKIMLFLAEHGISFGRAVRIYRTYGQESIAKIKENPYRLADDIRGIGFKTADELAAKLGIDRNSPYRARAAVQYTLQDLAGQGHVGYPEPGVVEHTTKLVEIDQLIVEDGGESGGGRKDGRPGNHRRRVLALPDRPAPGRGRARPIRPPDRLGLPAPHAGHRRGKGHRLGRRKAGDQAGRRAAGSNPAGVPAEDAGHHGRAGRWEDHPRSQHSGNLHGQEDEMRAGCAHRQGGQTHGGNDRARRPRPSTGSWSSTRPPATSSETSRTRSTATCSCWTRFRWSMLSWATNSCGPFPPTPA